MLKKELRELFPPLLSRISLVIVPFILYVILPKVDFDVFVQLFTVFFLVSLLWIANNFGTQSFRREIQDNAFEYLLAFPFSLKKIILLKFLPKFFLISLMLIFYYLLYQQFFSLADSTFIGPLEASLFVLYLFITGFLISLIRDRSKRAQASFITFLTLVFSTQGFVYYYQKYSGVEESTASWIISIIACGGIIILILGILFLTLLRKFDYRSLVIFEKKMIMGVIVLFIIFSLPGLAFLITLLKTTS